MKLEDVQKEDEKNVIISARIKKSYNDWIKNNNVNIVLLIEKAIDEIIDSQKSKEKEVKPIEKKVFVRMQETVKNSFGEIFRYQVKHKVGIVPAFNNVLDRKSGCSGTEGRAYKVWLQKQGLKLGSRFDKRKKSKGQKSSKKARDWVKWRGKQIQNIMKYHNLNFVAANNYFGALYNNSNKQRHVFEKKLKRELEFPQIRHVDNNFQKVLIGIIKNCIESPYICDISFNMEGGILGIETRYEWNEFVEDIIAKSHQISIYFGVYNEFKIKNGVIKYGR